MAFADYSFYTNTYKGNILSESAFNTLSERSAEKMQAICSTDFSGVTDEADVLAIKKANCAIAEVLDDQGTIGAPSVVQSESVGGWSRSYASDPSAVSANSLIYEKMLEYLGNSGSDLMYQGVMLL